MPSLSCAQDSDTGSTGTPFVTPLKIMRVPMDAAQNLSPQSLYDFEAENASNASESLEEFGANIIEVLSQAFT